MLIFNGALIIYQLLKMFWEKDAANYINWLPVCFGLGIILYFYQDIEPSWAFVSTMLMVALVIRITWPSKIALIMLLIASGYTAAKVRTVSLHTSMIDKPLKNIIVQAQVINITLKGEKWQVVLETNDPQIPKKFRLTLRQNSSPPDIGSKIIARATLLPLTTPQTPGQFNFRRTGYFEGIGATGVLKEMIRQDPPLTDTLSLKLTTCRHWLNLKMTHYLSPEVAGIAIALVTGDRGQVVPRIRQDLTNAGLAHLLAISGLHLSLLAGLLILSLRSVLCLSITLAERWHLKKVTVLITWPMLLIYLLISGVGIPAQRAFVMISIVFIGILCDRPALSMRTISLAALCILVLTPESLLSASFQLSFAAVVALIASFEGGWMPLQQWVKEGRMWRVGIQYLCGTVATTMIASLATAPFCIYIFNRFSLTVILSNLLAVPLTALLIMPLLMLSILSLIAGGSAFIFGLLNQSILILVDLAQWVSAMPGSNFLIAKPTPYFLGLSIIGGLWLCLWRQQWRFFGVIPIALGILRMDRPKVPFLLLADFRNNIFLSHEGELASLTPHPNKYLREMLQRELGQPALPLLKRNHFTHKVLQTKIIFRPSTKQLHLFSPGGRQIITQKMLLKSGSHYIIFCKREMQIITSCHIQGQRPWSEKRCHGAEHHPP